MSPVESPVYVYGVVRSGAAAPRTNGVLDAPLEVVDGGPVAALVSPVASERVRAKRRDLLKHSDVLQAAHASDVVLPLRFGTLFASGDDLRTRFLEPRQGELADLLDRFRGLSEMRLRAEYDDQDAVLAQIVAGDEEIARLREQTRARAAQGDLVRLGELVADRYARRRRADADAVLGRLAERALDVREDEPQGEVEFVRGSFLIRTKDKHTFDELVDSVALGLRHVARFTCTGPMPPHSFVSLEHAGGG
jgi:hypothetical protein